MAPEDRIEMLKWLSVRNVQMPVSELAFLLGLPVAEDHVGERDREPRLPGQ